MAIVTRFCFEAAPVIAWAEISRAEGIGLPLHVGVAGPAKLRTLVKFALSFGVGPSLPALRRRARPVGTCAAVHAGGHPARPRAGGTAQALRA